MSKQCGHIQEPNTLKKALDLLCIIQDRNISQQVYKNLKEVPETIEKVLNIDKVDCFTYILKYCAEMRNSIIESPDDYGTYEKFQKCEPCCVNIIINLVPKLYTTLSYLYFQINDGLSGHDDGQWKDFRFNDTVSTDVTNYLNKWLINMHPTLSAKGSQAKLLPGGFKTDELSENAGDILMSPLMELVDTDEGGGYIVKFMLIMFSAANFTYESTALALAVIWAFCDGVVSERIRTEVCKVPEYKFEFKRLCESLARYLTLFAPKSAEFKNAVLASPFRDSIKQFDFSNGEFCTYVVDWITKVLTGLVGFLTGMNKDCRTCDPSLLQYGEVAGPFPYGFYFGGLWKTNGSWNISRDSLPDAVEKLIGCDTGNKSLLELLNCLDPSSKSKIEQCQKKRLITEATASGYGPGSGATSSAETSRRITDSAAAQSAATEVSNERDGHAGEGEHAGDREPSGSPNSVGFRSQVRERSKSMVNQSESKGEKLNELPIDNRGQGTDLEEGSPSPPPQQSAGQPSTGGEFGAYGDTLGEDIGFVNSTQSTITIGGATGGVAVLGGGCAALYFLNVGGIKTLITGVP
ncbi:ribosome-binding protein 1, putative [Babesia caballi]|uniref:Ribosome-binding protein 1, putative n=1 Tax=Babesia caballi TaxID=5871 RepID=A0AAV4M172_BABCB|nr:ribosome-binding protein 1, putative [Babesia caballi]